MELEENKAEVAFSMEVEKKKFDIDVHKLLNFENVYCQTTIVFFDNKNVQTMEKTTKHEEVQAGKSFCKDPYGIDAKKIKRLIQK